MDSRNAFERQLTDEIDYEVGPPQGVDAFAVTRQARSTKPRWRFTMSSTIKFAVASLALAVAGTAIILAEPGGQPGDGVAQPGTESATSGSALDEVAAADMPTGSSYFTGTYTPVGPPATIGSETTGPDGVRWTVGEGHAGETIETSDPRVSGSLSRVINWAFLTPNMDLLAATEAWRLENDGGSWTGQGTSVIHSTVGIQPSSFVTIELTGAGAYEGLTAVVLVDGTQNPFAIEGAVIAGELLPPSEPPAE